MALGNIKSAIISFVNESRKPTTPFSGTDLDVAIQLCLNDITTQMNALTATDDDQTLESGDYYLEYPTDYKDLISIVLINSNSVRQPPLQMLPEGHRQYRDLRKSSSATGTPEYYSEFDDKFWLWEPPSGDFTVEIEYYRTHPQTPADILLPEMFRNCIYFGTTFWKSSLQGNVKYMNIWGPIYEVEKRKMELLLPEQPNISEGI